MTKITKDLTALKRFSYQRSAAKRRKIEFKFTFEEWVAWWELQLGPEWMKYRGRRACDYVMARKGDVGAYELGNVMCITASQNLRLAKKVAPHKNGIKITREQAREIYTSEGSQYSIAKKYNVTQALVWCIKHKKAWKSALVDL